MFSLIGLTLILTKIKRLKSFYILFIKSSCANFLMDLKTAGAVL